MKTLSDAVANLSRAVYHFRVALAFIIAPGKKRYKVYTSVDLDTNTVTKSFTINSTDIDTSWFLYSFAGWLTKREQVITLSRYHEAGPAAEVVAEFCEANGLAGPDNSADLKRFVHPGINDK